MNLIPKNQCRDFVLHSALVELPVGDVGVGALALLTADGDIENLLDDDRTAVAAAHAVDQIDKALGAFLDLAQILDDEAAGFGKNTAILEVRVNLGFGL